MRTQTPPWRPLRFAVDAVNVAKSTFAPLPGTNDFQVDQDRFMLMDGTSAVLLSAPDPAADRYKIYHLLGRAGDQFVEMKQPTLFRKKDVDQRLLLFAGAYYYHNESVRGAEDIFSLLFGSRTKDHPQYLTPMSESPLAVDAPPDGTSITGQYGAMVLYGGQGHYTDQHGGRSDSAFEREGWLFLAGALSTPNEVFRARKGKGSLYEIEAWPSGTHRFPRSGSPSYIQASDNSVMFAIATVDSDRVVIARRYDEYSAFRDTGSSFEKISLEELSPHFFDLIQYDELLSRWNALECNNDSLFPREFTRETIDISDLIMEDEMGLRRSWKLPYRIYDVSYGGHALTVRVPDIAKGDVASVMEGFGEGDVEDLHTMLRSVPRRLMAMGNMVTIAPDRYRASGRYRRGGRVAFTYPWAKRGDDVFQGEEQRAELHILTFHELGHSFAEDASPEQRRRLEAAVNYAIQVDGKNTYYREGESKHWTEALAVAFGEYEKAGPMMQQVVLNLMINPAWQPSMP